MKDGVSVPPLRAQSAGSWLRHGLGGPGVNDGAYTRCVDTKRQQSWHKIMLSTSRDQMSAKPATFPLIYSCSGCSSAAQLTNALALQLTREGIAEMSCIAGVGGGVPALVRLARSGRPILALDGCHLACVRACLSQRQVTPDRHLVLADFGVAKRAHEPFDAKELDLLLPQLRAALVGFGV